MTNNKVIRKTLNFESAGFGVVILFLWINELFDIPHNLFRKKATPINYTESIFETCIVVLLAFFVIWATSRLLRRIRYLEGLLPVCSFCKKIRISDEWIPLETYVTAHSEAHFSHSICPKCEKEHYGKILKDDS